VSNERHGRCFGSPRSFAKHLHSAHGRRRADRVREPLNKQKTTVELIANMLAVPKAGMIEAAMKLQDAGLVRCGRNHVEVMDRLGFEMRACECYGVVKRKFARLLPDVQAT
jgi:hypothetical protein